MFIEKTYNHLKNKILENALLETDMNNKFGNKDVGFENYFKGTALDKAIEKEVELSTGNKNIDKLLDFKYSNNSIEIKDKQKDLSNKLKNEIMEELADFFNKLKDEKGEISNYKVEKLEDKLKKENSIFTIIKNNEDSKKMTSFKEIQEDILAYAIKEYKDENRKVLDVEIPAISIKEELKEKFNTLFNELYPNKGELVFEKAEELGITFDENGYINEFEPNQVKSFIQNKNNEVLEEVNQIIEIIKDDKNSRDISVNEFDKAIKETGIFKENGITKNLKYIEDKIFSDWRTEKVEKIIENKKFEEISVENPNVQKELKDRFEYYGLKKGNFEKLEENYNKLNKIDDMKQYEHNLRLRYSEQIKENNQLEQEPKKEKEMKL